MRPHTRNRIPLWLKLACTGFLAVMIPVFWMNYGPTNFLYFCDVALLLPPVYLGAWITALIGIVFVPTHFVLKKLCKPASRGEPT